MYKDSAWLFIGGLPYDLTEGDVIAVFSQYGEIVNINLVRDKKTGKQKGFCFLCYEDQRSTILAVDNLNGIKVLGRSLRVDHVADYKVPKENDKTDEETRRLYMEGCAPKLQIPVERIKKESNNSTAAGGIKLPERLPIRDHIKEEPTCKKVKVKKEKKKKEKKSKKAKKEKKSKKKKRRHSSSSSSQSSDESDSPDGGEQRSHKKTKRNRSRSR